MTPKIKWFLAVTRLATTTQVESLPRGEGPISLRGPSRRYWQAELRSHFVGKADVICYQPLHEGVVGVIRLGRGHVLRLIASFSNNRR
jgi:hypothetical protein